MAVDKGVVMDIWVSDNVTVMSAGMFVNLVGHLVNRRRLENNPDLVRQHVAEAQARSVRKLQRREAQATCEVCGKPNVPSDKRQHFSDGPIMEFPADVAKSGRYFFVC